MKNFLVYLTFLLIASVNSIYCQRVSLDLPCQYLKNFSTSLDLLKEKPRSWMSGDDGCVLSILDSLTYYYIRDNDEKYLVVIDSVAAFSDGYISEALSYNIGGIFESKPLSLISYLYRVEKENKTSRIKQLLVFYLSDKFYLDIPRYEESGMKDLLKELTSLKNKYQLTKEEEKFLDSLVEEINKIE